MRAQPPPGGHEVSSKGEEHCEARKENKGKSETFPLRRAAEGPASAAPRSCAFVHCVGGRGARLSHADLSEINSFLPTPCWEFFFFLAPWDIKLASCFFGLPLLPFG